jgi:hypothetical protein
MIARAVDIHQRGGQRILSRGQGAALALQGQIRAAGVAGVLGQAVGEGVHGLFPFSVH